MKSSIKWLDLDVLGKVKIDRTMQPASVASGVIVLGALSGKTCKRQLVKLDPVNLRALFERLFTFKFTSPPWPKEDD